MHIYHSFLSAFGLSLFLSLTLRFVLLSITFPHHLIYSPCFVSHCFSLFFFFLSLCVCMCVVSFLLSYLYSVSIIELLFMPLYKFCKTKVLENDCFNDRKTCSQFGVVALPISSYKRRKTLESFFFYLWKVFTVPVLVWGLIKRDILFTFATPSLKKKLQ